LEASPKVLKEKILEIYERFGFSKKDFEEKEKEVGSERFLEAIRGFCLKIFDFYWISHLEEMEHLRDKVSLRAYGQLDPLVEYKNEGFKLFRNLLSAIESTIAQTISKIQIVKEPVKPQPVVFSPQKKVGRNDPCPCGSGKKYKKCCWPKYG
jgi:preprotein translocase subunit SecA